MSVRTLPVTRAYASPDSRSARLYQAALRVMPGGSTRLTIYSPPYPPYAAFGQGCWLTALVHGHADPAVTEAAARQAARGAAFPMPTAEEIDLATLLVERLPGMDQVRFTNSGTEAVMLAVKAARAYTGRPEVSLGPTPAEWGPADRTAPPVSSPSMPATSPASSSSSTRSSPSVSATTALGKIIGGASPSAPWRRGKPAVPHGGTFNANPVTTAAGLATMRRLDAAGLPGGVTGPGSLFRLHPSRRDFTDYRSAAWTAEEAARAGRLYRALLDHGVLVGQNGLGCLSTPMAEAEVDLLVDSVAAAMAEAA